jgi:hypothetical protein
MIALAAPLEAPMIIRRCRIAMADQRIANSAQPYHAAKLLPADDAETYLRSCSDGSAALAQKALRNVLAELSNYEVRGACILLASGRELPSLSRILASHALIHTAEGEFYRAALRDACECCGIREIGTKERDVPAKVAEALGRSAEDVQSIIAEFRKVIGPPWTQDQKLSALAAWLSLAVCA